MTKALTPLKHTRVALVALTAILILAAFGAGSASAVVATPVNVHLRVEGATQTQFSGDVTATPRSVPGGADRPECRSNTTDASFSTPNALTAVADAVGAANVSTSGTYYGWGTLLCSVNGEFPADTLGGWLIRINQQDSTAPNGYVTATDPLTEGASVVLFQSPSYGFFTSSLELNLPTTAKTGQAVSGFVDSFDTSTDAKSAGAGAGVSGGGGSATAGSDGSFQIVFPTAGKYLVSATRAKSVRGSQWVTVSDEAKPVPVAPVTEKQINQKRRAGARANCRAVHPSKSGPDYIACIRTANALGHTVTKKDKRIAARAKCVHNYPQPSDSRTRCIRDANALGR